MNTFKIAFFVFLLTSASAFSQYNNYNRYGGGANRNFNRDYSSPKAPTTEEIERAKANQIDQIMIKLKSSLTLDDLQFIAIKNEITSNSKNIDIVMKKEDSEEDKSKEIKALRDRTDLVINSYLNKAQKEKYIALKEESKNGKKNKEDKKEHKTTEE